MEGTARIDERICAVYISTAGYKRICIVTPLSINRQSLVQRRKSFEEGREQVDGMLNVVRTGGLSNRMHGEHSASNIDCANTYLG